MEKVEQLREMRSAFRDILHEVLTLACKHLNIDCPVLQEISDFQKLAYRVGQIYGMPDASRNQNNGGGPNDDVFQALRLALE